MAHNTKPILVDVNGKPIPQYFNAQQDQYEVLLGQDGAARAILYGPNGQPITNESPLEVRARLLEELLGALNATKETNPDASTATLLALLRGLLASVGKEATLAAIKDSDGIKKIVDAVTVSGLENLATETKLEAVRTLVEDLKSELANIKANQLSGDQKVQLSGTIAEENRSRLREIAMATAPLYGGLVKMGTLTYNGAELPRPLRPWRRDRSFPVFRDDATTRTTVSFEGNRISITGVLWDVEMLRVGDQITVSGSNSNDGTYTLTNRTSTTLTVSETLTTEGAGASVSVTAAGDIPDRQGTNLNGYSITDTSSNPENVLQWHMFYDLINGKPSLILISDRGLVANVAWNHINGSGFVFGKTQTIDGQNYLCRLLTGGAVNRRGGSSDIYDGGLLPNEWDRYVMNGVDQDGPFFTGAPEPESADYQSGSQELNNTARRRKHNQAWHWSTVYTLCQEKVIDGAALRTVRGRHSARFWYNIAPSYSDGFFTWRPALVLEL